jgi:two-component sensor histidine kinase
MRPNPAPGSISAGPSQVPDAFRRLFDFVQEPCLLLGLDGRIHAANQAARRLLGPGLESKPLGALLQSDANAFCDYLRRATASRSPVVGAVSVQDTEGRPQRLRAYAALFSEPGEDGPTLLLMRCTFAKDDEFSVLARRIVALNAEIRQRRKAETELELALSNSESLLGELHHRVKNNTQILLGMVAAARRNAQESALLDFLNTMYRRLVAIGSVQQVLYQGGRLSTVPARPLVHHLSEALAEEFGQGATLSLDVAEAELSNDLAFPLAIMLSELLTNALTHGASEGGGRVSVSLQPAGGGLELLVADSGPGLARCQAARGGMSGLGMVHGLCRQTGGELRMSFDGGTCCTVRFGHSHWGTAIQ